MNGQANGTADHNSREQTRYECLSLNEWIVYMPLSKYSLFLIYLYYMLRMLKTSHWMVCCLGTSFRLLLLSWFYWESSASYLHHMIKHSRLFKGFIHCEKPWYGNYSEQVLELGYFWNTGAIMVGCPSSHHQWPWRDSNARPQPIEHEPQAIQRPQPIEHEPQAIDFYLPAWSGVYLLGCIFQVGLLGSV